MRRMLPALLALPPLCLLLLGADCDDELNLRYGWAGPCVDVGYDQ